MPLKDLTKADQELVLQCLRAITDGEIEDWEFQTRLGITRLVVKRMIVEWPEVDDEVENSDGFLAINNCMNEICHGIRLSPEEWALRFTQSRDAVTLAYKNWLRLGGQTHGGIR